MSAHHRPKDLTHMENNNVKSVKESESQSVISAHETLPPIRIKNMQM